VHLARRLREMTGSTNLCYAGGVALNGIANERIIREAGFRNVFIIPAADDSGPAIGAAFHALWELTGRNELRGLQRDALGRPYERTEIVEAAKRVPSVRLVPTRDATGDAVEALCDGKLVGWFDGGSEFGPRALGQRSILCDPRRRDAADDLNVRVKRREPFRPFAPAILLESVDEWFDLDGSPRASPFMLRVCSVRSDRRAFVPATVHVDGTGRLQTLSQQDNGRFFDLVDRFRSETSIPMVLNTSFNVAGQPIVETPEDAMRCLAESGLDCCVFDGFVAVKAR